MLVCATTAGLSASAETLVSSAAARSGVRDLIIILLNLHPCVAVAVSIVLEPGLVEAAQVSRHSRRCLLPLRPRRRCRLQLTDDGFPRRHLPNDARMVSLGEDPLVRVGWHRGRVSR